MGLNRTTLGIMGNQTEEKMENDVDTVFRVQGRRKGLDLTVYAFGLLVQTVEFRLWV